MNGVIYARFSSDHQREESIEGQIRICKEYAQKHGITIINEYVDRAISGKTDKRPSFQKMIADSDTKLFQVVIVYALDRFARNGKQSAIYENMLNLNGVQLHSATENITGSPSSIILKSMLQGMAEYYSAELATKITRGMTENALKGRWSSGIIPFGYTRDKDKHLIPHPINAYYLKKIFEMFVAGYKNSEIIEFLNSNGVKNSIGKEFNKSSFTKILTNKVYLGYFIWKDIKQEDAVPKIIEPELFYKAQRIIEMRKKADVISRRSNTYLLSSRIFCAHCDGPLQGMSGKSHTGEMHYYYTCSNKRRKLNDCKLPNINRDDVEDVVIKHLGKILESQQNIADIAHFAMSAQNAAEENAELLQLQAQERELKKKIENCIKAIENGVMSDTLIQRLHESESALETLKGQLTEAKLSLQASLLSEAQIIFFLNQMAQNINDKETIIRTLVRAVFVEYKKSSDEFTITARFNYCNTSSMNAIEEFKVRRKSQMVNKLRDCTNFLVHCTKDYFEFSVAIPRRKSQRPAM